MNPFDDTQDNIPVIRAGYGTASPPGGKQRRKNWRQAHMGDICLWGLVAAASAVILAGAVVVVPGARHEVASVADGAVHRHGSKTASPPQVTPAIRVPFAARIVVGPSPARTATASPRATPSPSRTPVRTRSPEPGPAVKPSPTTAPTTTPTTTPTTSPPTTTATTPTSPPTTITPTSPPPPHHYPSPSPSPSPSPTTVTASSPLTPPPAT